MDLPSLREIIEFVIAFVRQCLTQYGSFDEAFIIDYCTSWFEEEEVYEQVEDQSSTDASGA